MRSVSNDNDTHVRDSTCRVTLVRVTFVRRGATLTRYAEPSESLPGQSTLLYHAHTAFPWKYENVRR